MKKCTTLLLPAIMIFTLLMSGYRTPGNVSSPPAKSFYPKKVNAVIQDKCFGCHNPEARNEKARRLLNFVDLPNQESAERLDKANKLMEVLDKGTMPPKFITDRTPEKKLTEKETALLQKWAKKVAKRAAK
jgi:uncharacterized membrane protein